MYKKSLVICMVVLMVMTIGLGTALAEKTVVTIQMFSGPESQAMLPVVAYWNENYSDETGIEVKQISMSRVGYNEKIQSQLVSGSEIPDVIHSFSLSLGKFKQFLHPLNDFLNDSELMTGPDGETYSKSDMLKAAMDTVSLSDGQVLMIPKDMSELIMFYRTDLIEEPPTTWEEYVEVAKKFTKKLNPDSPTQYGNIVQGKYELWNFCTALEVIWPYGASIFKEGTTEPNFDNEATVKAFEVYEKLAETFPPGVQNAEFPEVLSALQMGQVPLAIQWNAAYPILSDPEQSPLVAGKIAIAAPPGVKKADGSIDRDMYLHTINLAINKNSKNKEEAFKFLAWASFGEGAKMYMDAGGSSPLIELWSGEEASDYYKKLASFVQSSGRGVAIHPDISEIIMLGSKWVQNVIIEEATAEEAAEKLNEDIANYLEGRN